MTVATRRLLSVGTAMVTGSAFLVAAGVTATPAPADTASTKSVIVVLRAQHQNLTLGAPNEGRAQAAHADQAPVVALINANGGTDVRQLVAPSAVAAHLSGAAIALLRADPAVAEIIPDTTIQVIPQNPPPPPTQVTPSSNQHSKGQSSCPFNPNPSRPLQEGEADTDIHASTGNPSSPDEANSIADGTGVIVANDGANNLAGNPNFTRPDGSHVVINAPDYTVDHSNDEDYGDVSSIAAQGTVTYQYANALPNSPVPAGCSFYIKGDAPGASVVDLSQVDTPVENASQVLADIDRMVTTVHADVISESFGSGSLPNEFDQALADANNAAIQAGVTVVQAADDAGASGTVAVQGNVISAGATDSFRLIAMADGYSTFQSNNLAALSSAGVAPNGVVDDLVAPGWYGGEAACAEGVGGCPKGNPTESMRGTSESAPLIAGAAADVIQAYRDTHNGASPTPDVVRQILTSTATDLDAAADQQGSGLLNIYRAVKAAQQMPGTTDGQGTGDAPSLVASPSQVDVTAAAGSTAARTASIYNTSNKATTVRASYRGLGAARAIGSVVTENVSAPAAGAPIPPEGATAANTIHFRVPGGLDQLNTKMIWPDPTNSNRLYFQLFNPAGALVQESYDDGSLPNPARNRPGRIPNIQYTAVQDPQPGQWTAKILWGGIDQDLAAAPITPGTFTGPVSFQVSGQNFTTEQAAHPVRVAAHSSVSIPLQIAMPRSPGDTAESVQLSASNGATSSLPIIRRSLIPSDGGSFTTVITSSVGRSEGQISTYQIDVPSNRSSLQVDFTTQDASANNGYTFFLVDPTGAVAATDTSPKTVNGTNVGQAALTATQPAAGRWTIDVELNISVSGNEFTQTVHGQLTDPS